MSGKEPVKVVLPSSIDMKSRRCGTEAEVILDGLLPYAGAVMFGREVAYRLLMAIVDVSAHDLHSQAAIILTWLLKGQPWPALDEALGQYEAYAAPRQMFEGDIATSASCDVVFPQQKQGLGPTQMILMT